MGESSKKKKKRKKKKSALTDSDDESAAGKYCSFKAIDFYFWDLKNDDYQFYRTRG